MTTTTQFRAIDPAHLPRAHEATVTNATAAPAPPTATRKPADPRLSALRRFALSITVFNILGHTVLGFEQAPIVPLTTPLVAYAVDLGLEWLDSRLAGRPPKYGQSWSSVFHFLLPAHIAAMATSMLLFAGGLVWPYWLAAVVAVVSKHVVKMPAPGGRWRHVLNPSNTGIVTVLLLFGWVGIAPPYQFTANVGQPVDWLVPLAVLFLGTMLNAKLTRKMPLILAWVAGFILQAVVRSVADGHLLLPALAPLTGVAFILFTNYMITDPGTTPFTRRGQITFGLGCAAWYGLLMALHVSFGLFFALVATCATRAACAWAVWLWNRRKES